MQENGSGVLSLLYSVLLSRGFDRITSDLQDQVDNCFIDPMGDCTQPLLNLMVIGKATPYLHNGSMVLDEESGVSLAHVSQNCIFSQSALI